MFKWLIELFASISSVFISGANKQSVAPPLNTAIIAYQETYYAPVVADPENFPWAKSIENKNQKVAKKIVAPSAPLVTTPQLPTPPLPPPPPQDSYLAIPEPIVNWLRKDITLKGTSFDNERTIDIDFDREYWRIETFAYWSPNVTPPKPPVIDNYFKLEIYEKGTNKLIYTMTSGTDEVFHKLQSLKKPGRYTFKVSTQPISEYEINFFVSPKIAQ